MSCQTSTTHPAVALSWLLLVVLTFLVGAACNRQSTSPSVDTGYRGEPIVLTAWMQDTPAAMVQVTQDQIAAFNQKHDNITVQLEIIPSTNYTRRLQQTNSAPTPDLLHVPSPFLSYLIWQNRIQPLPFSLDPRLHSTMAAVEVQHGRHQGQLFGLGPVQNIPLLLADLRVLDSVGARIPFSFWFTWTYHEFNPLLERLSEHDMDNDGDGRVLEFNRIGDPGGWTFLIYPLLASAGASLIEPHSAQVDGHLNGDVTAYVLGTVQSWFTNDFVVEAGDRDAFFNQDAAFLVGTPQDYLKARQTHGTNLLLTALPAFSGEPTTATVAPLWTITHECQSAEAASVFINYLMEPEQVLAQSRATGWMPTTGSALEKSELYQPGGPLEPLVQQLEYIHVNYPVTPAYPALQDAFNKALTGLLLQGEPVQDRLDQAAKQLQEEIQDYGRLPSPLPDRYRTGNPAYQP